MTPDSADRAAWRGNTMKHRAPDGECSEPGCTATFRDHSWGRTAATKAGWLLQKSGDNWCPNHLPEWVEEWRARQAEKKA